MNRKEKYGNNEEVIQ